MDNTIGTSHLSKEEPKEITGSKQAVKTATKKSAVGDDGIGRRGRTRTRKEKRKNKKNKIRGQRGQYCKWMNKVAVLYLCTYALTYSSPNTTCLSWLAYPTAVQLNYLHRYIAGPGSIRK